MGNEHTAAFGRCATVLYALLAGSLATNVSAAQLSFSGRISAVLIDIDTEGFTGVTVGQLFTGVASYGNSAADASNVFTESDEANYEFPAPLYGGSVSSGAITRPATSINVNIGNDHALSAEEAALASGLSGNPVSAGTLVDVWSIIGFGPGAFEQDPDPNDGDDTEILFNGGRLEVAFVSLDTSLLSSTDYQPLPPALGGSVFGAFFVEQADANGVTLLLAYGPLDDAVAVIPLPATTVLLAPALGLLAARRRRARP